MGQMAQREGKILAILRRPLNRFPYYFRKHFHLVVSLVFQRALEVVIAACADSDQGVGLDALDKIFQVRWYVAALVIVQVVDL